MVNSPKNAFIISELISLTFSLEIYLAPSIRNFFGIVFYSFGNSFRNIQGSFFGIPLENSFENFLFRIFSAILLEIGDSFYNFITNSFSNPNWEFLNFHINYLRNFKRRNCWKYAINEKYNFFIVEEILKKNVWYSLYIFCLDSFSQWESGFTQRRHGA